MDLQQFINVSMIIAIDLVILVIIYMIVSFFRLKNSKKPFEELHTKLDIGCSVLLANGFYGKVVSLDSDIAMVEIAPKVQVKVSRFAIQSIVEAK